MLPNTDVFLSSAFDSISVLIFKQLQLPLDQGKTA